MNERKPCCSGPAMSSMGRREMLGYLGGGIGSIALAGVFQSLALREARAETGRVEGAALPPRAKHVICLFMAGGPSQLDLFDPKPLLARYAGQRPPAVDLRTERSTGGLLP